MDPRWKLQSPLAISQRDNFIHINCEQGRLPGSILAAVFDVNRVIMEAGARTQAGAGSRLLPQCRAERGAIKNIVDGFHVT